MSKAIDNLKEELENVSADHIMITVKRSDIEQVVREDFLRAEEWDNQACLGYSIKAALEIGLTEEEINKLVGAMQYAFDMKTVSEAAAIYRNSSY